MKKLLGLTSAAIIVYMEMCGRVAVVAKEPVFSVVHAKHNGPEKTVAKQRAGLGGEDDLPHLTLAAAAAIPLMLLTHFGKP